MRKENTFLMVDDDEDDRELFAELLAEIDPSISVRVAENGLDAIKMLEEPGDVLPDLLFLDVNMPEMDGKEFLSCIKGDERLKHIPVIVFTTSSQQKDVREMLKRGALCFITKPASMKEIRAVLSILAVEYPAELEKALEKLRDFSFVFWR